MPTIRNPIKELVPKDKGYCVLIMRKDYESGKSWKCASLQQDNDYGEKKPFYTDFNTPEQMAFVGGILLKGAEAWQEWLANQKPAQESNNG